MRDIEAPNHLLHIFEAGIDLTPIGGDTHSSKEWNGTETQWIKDGNKNFGINE